MRSVDQRNKGDGLETVILTSSKMLPDEQAREKTIKLAILEETIKNLVDTLPTGFQTLNLFVKKEENGTSAYLDLPLFYRQHIDVFFKYVNNKGTEYSRTRELSKSLGINTEYSLALMIFSDSETKEMFEDILQEHPKQSFFLDTTYFFTKSGKFAKAVELPEEIKTSRASLLDDLPIYKSIMTAEDFMYAERALSVIKDRIEDYLQFGPANKRR